MPKHSVGEHFPVALVSGIKKVWIREEGGGYQNLPSKLFCLTVPKNFVGEPFSVSLIAGTEKVWIRERGSIKIVRRKINFRRGNF